MFIICASHSLRRVVIKASTFGVRFCDADVCCSLVVSLLWLKKWLRNCRNSLLWCLCLFFFTAVHKHSRAQLNIGTTGEDADGANNLLIFPGMWRPSVQLIDSPILQKPTEKSNTTKKSRDSVCVHTHRIFFPSQPLPHIFARNPVGSGRKVFGMQTILKSAAAGILFIRPQCFEKYKSLQKFNLSQKHWVMSSALFL